MGWKAALFEGSLEREADASHDKYQLLFWNEMWKSSYECNNSYLEAWNGACAEKSLPYMTIHINGTIVSNHPSPTVFFFLFLFKYMLLKMLYL